MYVFYVCWDGHEDLRKTKNKGEKKKTKIEDCRITGKGGGVKWKSDKDCQDKGLGESGKSGRVDERRKNVDLLTRSSLEKERTDNMGKKMAEVCEDAFRRALFKLNACILQSKYIFRLYIWRSHYLIWINVTNT